MLCHLYSISLTLLFKKYNMVLLHLNDRRGNMKSYRKELWFEVPARRGFINITPQIEECLRESEITEGLVLCNAKQI